MIKVLVVDDETPAREELIYMLKRHSDIEVIDEADNGIEAIEKVKGIDIDAIFLDINMPKMGGIEVAKEIIKFNKNIKIIFVTAYDEYALKAFEVNAVDYILKPISDDRFKNTMDKLINRIEVKTLYNKDIEKVIDVLSEIKIKDNPERVSLHNGEKLIPIDLKDIIYTTIENKNTVVWTIKGKFNINYTLTELEEKWSFKFFRTHKSFLVNLDFIEEIEPWFNSTYNLKLKDSKEKIPVSRSQVKRFKKVMNMD